MRYHVSSTFAIVVGLFLLVAGLAGLSSPVVFDILTTNQTHAMINILLGASGIGFGAKGPARVYCLITGILLLFSGIFFFVPGTYEFLADLLNINPEMAYVQMAIGVLSLIAAAIPFRK